MPWTPSWWTSAHRPSPSSFHPMIFLTKRRLEQPSSTTERDSHLVSGQVLCDNACCMYKARHTVSMHITFSSEHCWRSTNTEKDFWLPPATVTTLMRVLYRPRWSPSLRSLSDRASLMQNSWLMTLKYRVRQKILPPLTFSDNFFPKRLRIFTFHQNFHLLI